MSPVQQIRGNREMTLRELRELSGMSLAELAEKVGISEGMLSYFEKGQRTLAATTKARLEEILTEAFTKKMKEPVSTRGVPLSAVTATFVIAGKSRENPNPSTSRAKGD